MDESTPQPPRHQEDRNTTVPGLSCYEYLGLALWGGAVVFWTQFALASGEELELQPAFLGWTIVAILLLGGLAFWAAHFHSRKRTRS